MITATDGSATGAPAAEGQVTPELAGASGADEAGGVGDVTFTAHELLALLEWRPGPEAELSREALRLPGTSIDQLTAAGNATLMVRDMFRLDGDAAGPAGAASVVGYVLTAAHRWVSVTFGEPDANRVVLLVDSDPVALMIAPRMPQLFDVLPLPEGTGSPHVVPATVERFLDQPGRRAAHVEVTTARGNTAVSIGNDGDGRLWCAGADGERRPAEPDTVADLLGALVLRP